mgnify:FL=1
MNRPDSILVYDELDLKLGIKSSLPHVKSTLALAVLIWECADHPSEITYSQQEANGIIISDEVDQWITDYLADICEEEQIDVETLMTIINQNLLLKSQMEALIVAFELVWKIAKIDFIESGKPASSERTGGVRYPKKLKYSVNIDIIHSVISSNENAYKRVLMAWTGFDIDYDIECETTLTRLFTALSEGAVFKLTDGDKDVVFNQNSIYRKIIETNDAVDVNGDKEAKGSLRILKSLLSDNLNPYLRYSNGSVTAAEHNSELLEDYQQRVDTFLRLSATKVIGLDSLNSESEGVVLSELESNRLQTGTNVLLYGVPGSGKSWTIEHEYRKPGSKVVRLVFHPDYTYSDFIGQILPSVSDNGQVSYKFTPGPFTTILRDSYNNPDKEYILIIEEINRGNAPAIFGEVFQLLDRKVEIKEDNDDGFPVGTSEYGIINKDIATIMYGKDRAGDEVRIPSNLSIIGTMNTSDQNVFTLDTAFQRRWDMRLIENNFDNVEPEFADAEILDTGVTWKNFCTEINNIVLGNGVRVATAEDKRLGAYFVHPRDLKYDDRMGNLADGEYDNLRKKESAASLSDTEKARLSEIREAMKQNRRFSEKVIKYLWDDAFKFNREVVFESTEYQSLEQIIRVFMYSKGFERLKIFKDNVQSAFQGNEEA